MILTYLFDLESTSEQPKIEEEDVFRSYITPRSLKECLEVMAANKRDIEKRSQQDKSPKNFLGGANRKTQQNEVVFVPRCIVLVSKHHLFQTFRDLLRMVYTISSEVPFKDSDDLFVDLNSPISFNDSEKTQILTLALLWYRQIWDRRCRWILSSVT